MPLSKKRNKERMRLIRKAGKLAHHALDEKREQSELHKLFLTPQESNAVQPKDKLVGCKYDVMWIADNGGEIIKIVGGTVQPKHLPNCPDGRYRE